jgi:hypothetical protein
MERVERIDLNGGELLIIRVFGNGECKDHIFMRDKSQPKESNCWLRVLNYTLSQSTAGLNYPTTAKYI